MTDRIFFLEEEAVSEIYMEVETDRDRKRKQREDLEAEEESACQREEE